MDELANDLSCAMIGADVDDTSALGAPGKDSDNLCELNMASHDLLAPPRSTRKTCSSMKDSLKCGDASSAGLFNLVKSEQGKLANGGTIVSKLRHNKPVARSASILLRSKILILSDSDSDEVDHGQAEEEKESMAGGLMYNCLSLTRKNRMKKNKRKKGEKERPPNQLALNPAAFNQYFGKRKRSTTLFSNATEEASGDHGSDFQSQQNMDCDHLSFESSSLSESNCDSDQFVDADDEQSDFYEVISRSGKENPSRTAVKHFTKSTYHQSIPIPKNPFASVPSTPSSSFNSLSSSSTAFLWKRRRQNHRSEV